MALPTCHHVNFAAEILNSLKLILQALKLENESEKYKLPFLHFACFNKPI